MEKWGLMSTFGILHDLRNKSTLPSATYVFYQHQQEKKELFDNTHIHYSYKLFPVEFTLVFLLQLPLSWLWTTQLLLGLLLLGLPHFFFFLTDFAQLEYFFVLTSSLLFSFWNYFLTDSLSAGDISNHGPSTGLLWSSSLFCRDRNKLTLPSQKKNKNKNKKQKRGEREQSEGAC